MKTEQEQFAACDAVPGDTLIAFSDRAIADRYVAHRAASGSFGLIAMVEDTREKTGLCVIWRDPVKAAELEERQANCRWLLEQILSGKARWPVAGEVLPATWSS